MAKRRPMKTSTTTNSFASCGRFFSDGAECERDTAISKLASQIGLEKPSSPLRAEIDSVLRSAVQRGILESSGDVLQLSARSIGDYSRDQLKTQFLCVTARVELDRERGCHTHFRQVAGM